MDDIPLPPAVASITPMRPAGRPTYGRTQSAPFVFGVAVGAIWFWQRLLVALALGSATQRFTALSEQQVVAIALGVVALFFIWPAAAAVCSTIGDARFWGMGASACARVWPRLALALVLAFGLGSGWLLQAFAPYGGNPSNTLFALGYYLAPYPVPPFAPLVTAFAFMVGLLAAFAFARWPLPAARFSLLTQVARWIAVGAIAAVGAFLMDALLVLASYMTGIVVLHNVPSLLFNLSLLTRVLGPIPPAATGGLIGGLLRAGLARPGPATPIAPAPATMPAGRRIAAWLRGAGAVGTGLLLGGCWVGALFLIAVGASARPAISLLLVAPPLLIVMLAALRGRGFWAAMGTAGWRWPALRLVLALIMIVVGAVPALALMLTFPSVNGPIIQVFLAAPVLSASLAIGFAWGRGSGGRGWWSAGTRAALLGALGYSLCFAGLIAYVITWWLTPRQPVGGLGGAAIAFAYYLFSLETLSASLCASFAFAALGGVLGAALRVAPPAE